MQALIGRNSNLENRPTIVKSSWLLRQGKESMDEILAQINKRFDELDAYIKWVIGFELFVFGGVLMLIVKVFFFGPLD